jgi:hypothetical protein
MILSGSHMAMSGASTGRTLVEPTFAQNPAIY